MTVAAAASSSSTTVTGFMTPAQVQANQTAAATNASALAQANSASTIGSNFNTFINILTTQLQNQDPTSPTDPNQFTQELVQFAGVEQQLNTNNDLQSLINLQKSNSLSTGVGYIGNYVQAPTDSNQLVLQNGSSEFGFTLASAANVTVSVQDANGNTLATLTGSGTAGANYVSWNGVAANGTQEPDGTYTFSVSATDASENAVAVSNPVAIGKVNNITSNSDGTLELSVGNMDVSSGDITNLFTSSQLPKATITSSLTASSS